MDEYASFTFWRTPLLDLDGLDLPLLVIAPSSELAKKPSGEAAAKPTGTNDDTPIGTNSSTSSGTSSGSSSGSSSDSSIAIAAQPPSSDVAAFSSFLFWRVDLPTLPELDAIPPATTVSSSEPASVGNDEGLHEDWRGVFQDMNDRLRQNIVDQIEFYFGDANLTTDKFLMQHIKRSKQGYVPIGLLCTFNKIKKLCKNPRAVAEVLKERSTLLEVSEDMRAVKRLNAFASPIDQEAIDTRTVVIQNYPVHSTPESIRALCAPFGKVEIVRFASADQLQPHQQQQGQSTKSPRIIGDHYYVQFQNMNDAIEAVAKLHSADDWRSGLRVMFKSKPKIIKPRSVESSSAATQVLSVDGPHGVVVKVQDHHGFIKPLGHEKTGGQWIFYHESRAQAKLSLGDKVTYRLEPASDGSNREQAVDVMLLHPPTRASPSPEVRPTAPSSAPSFPSSTGDRPRLLLRPKQSPATAPSDEALTGATHNATTLIARQPRGPDGTIGFRLVVV